MVGRSATRCFLAAILFIALGGCDGRAPDPAQSPRPPAVATPTEPPESPDRTAAPAGRCSNQERALTAGDPIGGRLQGDVDGDGSRDSIFLVRDEGGDPDCRNFLVAETNRGVLVTPTNEPGAEHALETPRIHSFAQIDGEGGEEILVELERGASTQFLGMFTVVGGDLRRVEIAEQTEFGSLFPYGGSAGHIEASNCSEEPGADVVITLALANAADYTIRSRLYRLSEDKLEPLPPERQPDIRIGPGVQEMQGAETSPFGDCPRES